MEIEKRQQYMEIMECMDRQGYLDLKAIIDFREGDESFESRLAFKIAMDIIFREIDLLLEENKI